MEEKSLKEEIVRLRKTMETSDEELKKEKAFKLPGKARLSKSKLKKNYAIVAFINENKQVTFTKEQIKEGTIIKDGCPYIATPEYMLHYNGKPLIIQPSWSVEPFSSQRSMEEAAQEKRLSVGYRLLLNAMKSEVIAAKKKMNIVFVIIGLIVLAGAAYFIITKSGGFHF